MDEKILKLLEESSSNVKEIRNRYILYKQKLNAISTELELMASRVVDIKQDRLIF